MTVKLIKQGSEQYKNGRYQEALTTYADLLKLYPEDAVILTIYGQVLNKLDRHQEALEYHNHSLELSPNNTAALNNRANTYQSLGNDIDALKDYDCYLAINSYDADIHFNRGVILDKLKRYQEAIESYNHSLALRSSGSIYGPTLHNRGNTFKNLGNYAAALKDYDCYLTLEPRDADLLANRGWVLDKLKRYQEAVESYNRSLVLRPVGAMHPYIFNDRANALKNLGDYTGALKDYDTYLCLKPNDAEAHANCGWVLNKLGYYQKALTSYNHSLELQPNYALALANRSKILRRLANKGNKKEKEEVSLLSKALVKTKGALHYIILVPMYYVASYFITNIGKLGKRFKPTIYPLLTKEHQITKPRSGFLQENKEPRLDIPSKTTSTKKIKADKYPNKKPIAKKSETIITSITQNAIVSLGVNQEPTEEISNETSFDSYEVTTNVGSPLKPLISENGELLDSNSATKGLEENRPTSFWQKKILLPNKTFFEYFFGLLYAIIIAKVIRVFKSSGSDTAILSIQNSHKTKKTIELQHPDESVDSTNYSETQNLSDKSMGSSSETPEITLQEAKEKMSGMEILLAEQAKTILFMKQKFDELQENPLTKIKSTEQTEPLQEQLKILQKQLQQDSDLKRHCEEQVQRIKFLESETKNAQVPLIDSSQSSVIEAQLNQLKSQLAQMQSLYEKSQSQIPRANLAGNGFSRQNSAAIPFVIQVPSVMPLGTSEVYVQLPEPIFKILFSLKQANYCALIVGGAVRDFLLRKTPADVDIITNMPGSILLSHFNEYSIHATPYVLGLYQISIAGLKIDISYCDTAVFISNAAFRQNALTRAFTVNALYCDFQGRVYDPLQIGLFDLVNQRILRLISVEYSWFERDPFLLLRGARLAVQYGLAIPLETKQLMQHFSPLLENNDQQRLYLEFKRLFLRGYALKNFEKLMELSLLKSIFPKTVEFLLSHQGQCYKAWLQLELHKTDQLFIVKAPLSITYIYAIFLTGGVLGILEQPIIISSKIDQSIDKTLTEAFLDQSNTKSLEKIKKMIVACIRKMLLAEHSELPEALALTPIVPIRGLSGMSQAAPLKLNA